MKALIIDFMNLSIEGEVETNKKVIDEVFYDTPNGPVPIAYLLKPECRPQIERILARVEEKKKEYETFAYRQFTKMGEFRI